MKVLAALDFGESSLEALRQARALAHGIGGTLAACHVLPIENELAALLPERLVGMKPDHEPGDAAMRADLLRHVREHLGLELTELFLMRGSPYAEIVRCATEWGADYVVVGSHGRSGLVRVVLGSVAERVVRHAHSSVLVARTNERAGVVLAATDFSQPSMAAVLAGADAAKRSGARLVIVSALDWTGLAASSAGGLIGSLPALPPPELQQQMRQTLLSTLEQAVVAQGVKADEVRVLEGPPAAEIVACAEQVGAELIVVGTHGRTGLVHFALGSVAERVVRSAPCSVLAVRAAGDGAR